MGLDKYIITCIHHYGITQSIFTALKILCAPPSSLVLPTFLGTIDLFTVSKVLPFPECHIAGIIQYVAFSD